MQRRMRWNLNPMTGIGGDCFVLLTGSDDIKAMNGSGKAPAGLTAEMLREKGHVSPAANPRCSDSLKPLMHLPTQQRLGQAGLDALLAPSIHYAKEGILVAPRVGYDWAHNVGDFRVRQKILQR